MNLYELSTKPGKVFIPNNIEKLNFIIENTLKYKIKNGKFYSKINGEWKELKDYYKKGN